MNADTPTPRMDLIDVCERLRRINSHQITHERAVAIIERQERELAALRTENARLQSELDESCNAEELRQVRAENAGLKEDAERYRWLKEECCERTTWYDEEAIPAVELVFKDLGKTLDEAIDAARRAG